jgi:ribosomal protein L37AE/L43A
MWSKKTKADKSKPSQVLADARRSRQQREKEYREKALKIYPWICARCGREFAGKRLRELTVHHKDHNHDHNPPDGSNWELLCIYCHDNEHSRYLEQEWHDGGIQEDEPSSSLTHRPFTALEALLKKKSK